MDKKSFLAAGVSVLLVAAVCIIPTLNRSRSAVLSSVNIPAICSPVFQLKTSPNALSTTTAPTCSSPIRTA